MKKKIIITAGTLCALALLMALVLWPRKEMKPVLLDGLRFSIPTDWEEAGTYSFLYRFRYGSVGNGEARFQVENLDELRKQRYLPDLPTVWGPESAAVLAEDTSSRSHKGYTAVSTEATLIGGQAAAIHRFRAPRNGDGWNDCIQYAVGTDRCCVRISVKVNADTAPEARKTFESDLEAVIQSLDLTGLEGFQTPSPSPTPEQEPSPEPSPVATVEEWRELELYGLKFSVPENWWYNYYNNSYDLTTHYDDVWMAVGIYMYRFPQRNFILTWYESTAESAMDMHIDKKEEEEDSLFHLLLQYIWSE